MYLANLFPGIIVSRVASNGCCEVHGNTHLSQSRFIKRQRQVRIQRSIQSSGPFKALHILLPWQTCSLRHHFGFSGKHPAIMLQLMREGCSYTYPPLSIARYSSIGNWSNVQGKNLPKVLTAQHKIRNRGPVVESPKLYSCATAHYLSVYCCCFSSRFGFFRWLFNGRCLWTDISHSIAVILNRFCQARAQLSKSPHSVDGILAKTTVFRMSLTGGLLGIIPSLPSLTGSAKLADRTEGCRPVLRGNAVAFQKDLLNTRDTHAGRHTAKGTYVVIADSRRIE